MPGPTCALRRVYLLPSCRCTASHSWRISTASHQPGKCLRSVYLRQAGREVPVPLYPSDFFYDLQQMWGRKTCTARSLFGGNSNALSEKRSADQTRSACLDSSYDSLCEENSRRPYPNTGGSKSVESQFQVTCFTKPRMAPMPSPKMPTKILVKPPGQVAALSTAPSPLHSMKGSNSWWLNI